ncbi:MAG: glycosyltransferase family 9 protein [Candidatus Brocadiaceae bacterium]|nr:glycosyltransferase family 9 protein [Candidatus Brocadiaceae bacterium]
MFIGIKNKIIKCITKCLFRYESPHKIAIYRYGSFGDSIVSFPALNAIREGFTKCEIHIYNKLGADNLISMQDLLNETTYDKIITLKKDMSSLKLRKMLAKERYDLYIELSTPGLSFTKILQKFLFLKISKVKYATGFDITPGKRFSKYYKKTYPFVSERERLLNNLKDLNVKNDRELIFPLKNISKNIEKVKNHLQNDKLNTNRLIIFAVKSKRESSSWRIDNWVELASKLRTKKYDIVMIGGKADREFIDKITINSDKLKIKSYAGKLNILDSAALIKIAKLVISVDSGPMHLAYAQKTKLIALFSARDYVEKWYPPTNRGTVLRYDIECSPCFLDKCPKDNECINNITVEEVEETVGQYI